MTEREKEGFYKGIRWDRSQNFIVESSHSKGVPLISTQTSSSSSSELELSSSKLSSSSSSLDSSVSPVGIGCRVGGEKIGNECFAFFY